MITPTHVAGATDAQLICITYELFLEAIKDKNIKQAKKYLMYLLRILISKLS